jgi:hypothetical protein
MIKYIRNIEIYESIDNLCRYSENNNIIWFKKRKDVKNSTLFKYYFNCIDFMFHLNSNERLLANILEDDKLKKRIFNLEKDYNTIKPKCIIKNIEIVKYSDIKVCDLNLPFEYNDVINMSGYLYRYSENNYVIWFISNEKNIELIPVVDIIKHVWIYFNYENVDNDSDGNVIKMLEKEYQRIEKLNKLIKNNKLCQNKELQ